MAAGGNHEVTGCDWVGVRYGDHKVGGHPGILWDNRAVRTGGQANNIPHGQPGDYCYPYWRVLRRGVRHTWLPPAGFLTRDWGRVRCEKRYDIHSMVRRGGGAGERRRRMGTIAVLG